MHSMMHVRSPAGTPDASHATRRRRTTNKLTTPNTYAAHPARGHSRFRCVFQATARGTAARCTFATLRTVHTRPPPGHTWTTRPRRDDRRTYTFYHLPYSIRPPSQRQATARTRRSSHAQRVAGITLGCTQTPSTTRMQQPSANEHLRHTQYRTVARGRSPAAERELAQLSSRTPPARGPSPGVQWMPRQAGVRTCSPAKRGRPAP